ncbi:hypothetical protein CMI37_18965 [Candidatus Pacearchaeota archaeon]|nr:hypothetical protein [Candidatus Pacearchaeota archaeon]
MGKKPIPVAHTCPDIDKLARLLRRHICPAEDRKEALALLEELREANSHLRDNAAYWQQEAERRSKELWAALGG